MNPVVSDGLRPLHKGPAKLLRKRTFIPDDIFNAHFGMVLMTEAATELENYCADPNNPTTTPLIWIDCGCGTKFLSCDDYVCRSCRASL